MNIALSTGQSVGLGSTILQVSRDGKSLFVSEPVPELGGRWYGPDVVGVRTIIIQRRLFSREVWRGLRRGMTLRFDEFRLRPVERFALKAGATYWLYFDADQYPNVIRLRPTEANQIQAYRALLLAGVNNVHCFDTLSGQCWTEPHETCATDGETTRKPVLRGVEQTVFPTSGTFAVVGVKTDGGIHWTRACITPDVDVPALLLSLSQSVKVPAPV